MSLKSGMNSKLKQMEVYTIEASENQSLKICDCMVEWEKQKEGKIGRKMGQRKRDVACATKNKDMGP